MNKNIFPSKKIVTKELLIKEKMINDFLIITGDQNPIHFEDNFIQKHTDFKEKVVPGALILSLFSAIFGNEFPGNGSIIIKQEVSYKKPIFLGAKIKLVVEELSLIKFKTIYKLNTLCYDNKNNLAIQGISFVQNNLNKTL